MRVFRALISPKGALILTLVAIAIALVQLGLPAVGFELTPGQGYALLSLAALCLVGAIVIVAASLLSYVGQILSWTGSQIRERWPLALARTVKQLRENNQRIASEKIALEEDKKQLMVERNGQIGVRCLELSDDLDRFLKEQSQKGRQDQEIIHRYRELFATRVAWLVNDLKRLEWWGPQEPEKLENPETRDDIRSLSGYVRWFWYQFR